MYNYEFIYEYSYYKDNINDKNKCNRSTNTDIELKLDS